jgi:hypothetical protein
MRLSIQPFLHLTVCLVVGFLFAFSAPAFAGGVVTASFDKPSNTLKLVVNWKDGLRIKTQSHDNEMVIGFDRGIDVRGLEDAIKASDGLLVNGSYGYDSLLLQSREDRFFRIVSQGNEILLMVDASAEKADAPTEEDRIRMQLLDARLQRETGHNPKAMDTLKTLDAKYPEHVQVSFQNGITEEYLERWRDAHTHLLKAHRNAPQNEDVAAILHRVWEKERPRVKLDHEWEHRGSTADLHVTTLSGHAYLKPYTRIGVTSELNRFDTDPIRRANGVIEATDGVRHRNELYLQHAYEGGDMARASLYAGSNAVGAGAQYRLADDYGSTRLYAEYQRPNWDFIEGIAESAVRDRVGVDRRFVITPRLYAGLGGALNRYDLENDDDVARTVSWNGNVRYQIYPGDPILTLGYAIDGEYRKDEMLKLDAGGVQYLPLPLRSREIHFVDVSAYKEINEDLVLQGYLGYGYDRLGDSGPAIGGSVTKSVGDHFEAQARASHSLSVDGADVDRVGGYVAWKWN